ncbi:hypothetical protein DL95DRAFT_493634 [Leptodontidium sp. 2 PMI_412]|nr:hypothetical protein DL95DRAFT_493634 [Leptodontidium sp. 2 PMI_412]
MMLLKKRLLKRLEDEHYLDYSGETREDIVRYATLEFENRDKRPVDIARRPNVNWDDYDEIVMPCLQRTAAVLQKQIDGALQLGINVKVREPIRATSPSPTKSPSITAIAASATIRALNLEHGPKRTALSSYGFLRTEPYEPDKVDGHLEAEIKIDPFDDGEYVSVIDYFLHKEEVIPPVCRYEPFRCTHDFGIDEKKFMCTEILYVNDSDGTESYYDVNHAMNAGAQEAGRLVVDMSFLREEGHISPIIPEANEDSVVRGKPYYQVIYDLAPIVEGRDLKYVAMYPANDTGEVVKTG